MYTDNSKTTFIPKAPVTTIQQPTSITGVASSEKVAHGIGFVGWIGLLIMVATLVGSIGVFLYVGYFQAQRTQIINNIKQKNKTVDADLIVDAQRLSTRIGYVDELLEKQIYVTPLFEALHAKTLPSVQFDNFELREKTAEGQSLNTPGSYQAVLRGKAKSYEVIAQQSDVYATVPELKTHFFTQFKIDTTKNLIGFELSIDLPPKLGHDRFLPPVGDQPTNSIAPDISTTPIVSTTPIPAQ
jgi:hypothetical protein